MQSIEVVTKSEVEDLLGYEITDEQFEKALGYAKRKQKYIYQGEQREVVMQHWYLAKLTEEYVRSLAFSKLTEEFCQMRRNMEKEHLTRKCIGTPAISHIVAVPVL